MITRPISTGVDHDALRRDVLDILAKHGKNLSAEEMLALLANMTGQMAAMMDQRRFTPKQVAELIHENIRYGNQAVADQLKKARGPIQ